MKVIFRVDAHQQIGNGHLMRCLAIAEQLIENHEVLFLSNSDLVHFKTNSYGINCTNYIDELNAMKKYAQGNHLIIDNKNLYKIKDISNLKNITKSILMIENISAGSSQADAILFPAAHLDERIFNTFGSEPLVKKVKKLEGWDWILIRSELRCCINNSIKTIDKKKIIVTTGGSDPQGVIFKLSKLLELLSIKATVLVGENFKYPRSCLNKFKSTIFKDYNVNELSEASIVISTFGTSVYEAIFMKKPVISVAHSKENAQSSKILSDRCEWVEDIGYFDYLKADKLDHAISKMVTFRKEKSMPSIIDGLGVKRVINFLESLN